MTTPRIAKSLDVLRTQVNARWPNRSKASDGWIGDTAHAARKSDHNPNREGVVQALDISNDPKNGPDARKLADALVASKDPRIKYVISDGRIASSYVAGGRPAWSWGPYTGANRHDKHNHVSVVDVSALYDDTRKWDLSHYGGASPSPDPPKISLTAQRQKMGRLMIGYETQPPLRVEIVSDGTREVAGVNERYHPDTFAELQRLVASGQQEQAKNVAAQYVVDYTTIAATWTNDLQVEFYLRDCVFNRGPTGAAKILQMAVGVPADGAVGPQTLAAARDRTPESLLTSLRSARERYERTLSVLPGSTKLRDESWNRWKGMVNRWNKALADSQQFKGMTVVDGVLVAVGAGTVIGGGAMIVTKGEVSWSTVIPIVIIIIGIAIVITVLVRRRRS